MPIQKNGVDPKRLLGSMFVGTVISSVLHGVTCCQVIWYFRTQSNRSSKSMKALILYIWLGETLNCVFMFIATFHQFLSPAIARARLDNPDPCAHWSGPVEALSSSLCTLFIEGFFIVRMWRLSGRKKLVALAFIPYLASYGFGFTQIIKNFQVRCDPTVSGLSVVLLWGTYSCRLFGDSVVVFTMCYLLYVRSLGFLRHANTIKIVRELIVWSISTGVLTWFQSVFFLACYLELGNLPPSTGVYYVRAGLYGNAMLAQLNARTRFRAMAEATIPLALNDLNTLVSTQFNHESPHPLRAIDE